MRHVNLKSKSEIKGDVIIENIKYSETENVSISIIDFRINDSTYSILVTLFLSEDIMILKDSHTLRFVKREVKKEIVEGDRLVFNSTPLINNKVYEGGLDAADCISKDCCKWTEVVAGSEYNCGCPVTVSNEGPIVTTSDGCKIRL